MIDDMLYLLKMIRRKIMLEKLREKNSALEILPVESSEFEVYGMVHPEVVMPGMKEFVQTHRQDNRDR